MVIDSPHLLRAPPFPWARAQLGVSSQKQEIAAERLVAVMQQIRAARVGGGFWHSPVEPAALVLRPTRSNLSQFVTQNLRRPGRKVMLAETAIPAADAGSLKKAGIFVETGPVDPWSVLMPGVALVAEPDDEWSLLGFVAGADVIGQSEGDLLARLGQALGNVAYRNCFDGKPIEVEEAIAILAEWRRVADRTRPITVATGIAWWKQEAIERFFWLGRAGTLAVEKTADEAVTTAVQSGGAVAVWPARAPEGLSEKAAAKAVPLIAVEDGFIRSVGLGAGLHPPSSIILDERGIYYDPTRPSDLEIFLEQGNHPPALLHRAARLRETIVASGISKYASDAIGAAPPRQDDRRVVLVAGQVEDDKSVLTGGGGVAGNFDLLKRARALEPDACILFKPHPDVDAGHRVGHRPDAEMLTVADEIVRGESMAALLNRIDAVHVLTSLTGFEALLRGIEVTTHGGPFYAGWGLTRDLGGPFPRRTRRLTLDALVAGALLYYPLYLDPETQLPCPPEVLLERFRNQTRPRATVLTRARALQGWIAKLIGTTTD